MDLAESLLSDARARFCVVGSGPVGMTVAKQLARSFPGEVILIESGGSAGEASAQTVAGVENKGELPSGLAGSRARVLGGTSTLWGGQALPLTPFDFEARAWVPESGWPIEYQSLVPYFDAALRELAIVPIDGALEGWHADYRDIDGNLIELETSSWSPQPDFRRRNLSWLKGSTELRVVVNATVTGFILDPATDRIAKAELWSPGRKGAAVAADTFVLCAGGIENARLLLCSSGRTAGGLGNAFGNVGRYFQDHVAYYGARVEPLDFHRFKRMFSSVFEGDQMRTPKLRLSDVLQRREQVLNVNGTIGVEYNAESAVSLKRLFNSIKTGKLSLGMAADALRVMSNPVASFQLFAAYALERRTYFPRNADYFLIANCETPPVAESRITLSEDRDSAGMRMPVVEWRVDESVRRSMVHFLNAARSELERLGIARLHLKESLSSGVDWRVGMFSIYHHIGTTRMSSDPRSGVVDENCRVHGSANLYVCGCSVFPTSGSANPTLTAIALAFRLADHLLAKHRVSS